MTICRYLLHISYIGKSFRGAQRQVSRSFPPKDDPFTIQGRLEMGLKKLNSMKNPIVVLSSRTDSGVHALNSTVHVDIEQNSQNIFQPSTLLICLNKYFKKEDVPIRILKAFLVPSDFHCRHRAISRTYLYRLAIIKTEQKQLAHMFSHIPIEDIERCLYIKSNFFNIEELKNTAKLFIGCHDFRTFMNKGSKNPNLVTRKIVYKCDVAETKHFTYCPHSWPVELRDEISNNYQFLNIYIKSKGFLYKQVRRMVAALIAVAQGNVSNRDIKLMLQVPSHRSWIENIKTVPAYGLYLCEVEYSLEDQKLFKCILD